MADMYDRGDGVEWYVEMARGYDGREHMPRFRELVAPGARVLEIGMGPGTDLDLLRETFDVVGSDQSPAFLERYRRDHPDAQLELVDAVTIDLDGPFDAIYSNKVLHHLDDESLRRSLERQAELLRPGGITMHNIWAGDEIEDHEGMYSQSRTCASFSDLAPREFELVECTPYEEFEPDDSLRIVLRMAQ